MDPRLSNQFAITGIGEAPAGHHPDITVASLVTLACRDAMYNAGLTANDIDGVIIESPLSEPTFMFAVDIAHKLGISPRYTSSTGLGGAAAVSALAQAMAVIEAGLCSTVLFAMGDSIWSHAKGHQQALGTLNWGYAEFEETFGLVQPPGAYALGAQRHMYEYGTTAEAFGSIAVSARYHASLNANAEKRKAITLTDYFDSPWIVEPFRLLDCSLVSDFAGAYIISKRSSVDNSSKPLVLVNAVAQAQTHRYVIDSALTKTGAVDVANTLWDISGLGPNDVKVAELYDSFTYTLLVQLEDYGFCEKGKGGQYVIEKGLSLGDALPVNTHGGLLSQAHSGGILHLTEAVKQLRGECGSRQVPNADIALVSGGGGILFAAHAGALLQRVESDS